MKRPSMAEIWLYYKQGDDLNGYIASANGDQVQAVRNWARDIASAAAGVRRIGEVLDQHPTEEVTLDGDKVYLRVHGSEDVVEQLILEGLASPLEYDDDDENDGNGDDMDDGDEASGLTPQAATSPESTEDESPAVTEPRTEKDDVMQKDSGQMPELPDPFFVPPGDDVLAVKLCFYPRQGDHLEYLTHEKAGGDYREGLRFWSADLLQAAAKARRLAEWLQRAPGGRASIYAYKDIVALVSLERTLLDTIAVDLAKFDSE